MPIRAVFVIVGVSAVNLEGFTEAPISEPCLLGISPGPTAKASYTVTVISV